MYEMLPRLTTSVSKTPSLVSFIVQRGSLEVQHTSILAPNRSWLSTFLHPTEGITGLRRLPTPVYTYYQNPERHRTCLQEEGGSLTNCSWIGSHASLHEVGIQAEQYLGKERFALKSSLGDVFGNYSEIINLFTQRNSRVDHPLSFLASLLQAEARYRSGSEMVNPYTLWRSMMAFLATELFRPKDVQDLKPEVLRKTKTIERHQRMTKIAEIAYISQQIHRRILDSDNFPATLHGSTAELSKAEVRQRVSEFHDANKTATLVGDLLWSQICVHMASLKCQAVSEMICQFLMDYCEGEFVFRPREALEVELRTETWFHKTQLGLGSIMGTTISAMLGFDGHVDHVRNSGYQLGMLLALCYQAYADIMFFVTEPPQLPRCLDLGLLPIFYRIQAQPDIINEDQITIYQTIRNDPQVSARCYKTLKILQEDTLSYVESLDDLIVNQAAREILQHYVQSLVI